MVEQLPAFNVFHFKGTCISFQELAESIQPTTEKTVKLKSFPWMAIRVFSLFFAMYRGILEMRYLWDREINLDDPKLQQMLGTKLNHTQLDQILPESGLLNKTLHKNGKSSLKQFVRSYPVHLAR